MFWNRHLLHTESKIKWFIYKHNTVQKFGVGKILFFFKFLKELNYIDFIKKKICRNYHLKLL